MKKIIKNHIISVIGIFSIIVFLICRVFLIWIPSVFIFKILLSSVFLCVLMILTNEAIKE
jgi:hypothetical protein